MKNHFFSKFSSILHRASLNSSRRKKQPPMEANNPRKNEDDYDFDLPKKIVLKMDSKSSVVNNYADDEGSIIIRKFSKLHSDHSSTRNVAANTTFRNTSAAVGTRDRPNFNTASILFNRNDFEGVKFQLGTNNYSTTDNYSIKEKILEIEKKIAEGDDPDDLSFLADVKDIDNIIKGDMKTNKINQLPTTKEILDDELRMLEENLNASTSRSNADLQNLKFISSSQKDDDDDEDDDEDVEMELGNTILALQNQPPSSQPTSRLPTEMPQFLMLPIPKRVNESQLEENEDTIVNNKSPTENSVDENVLPAIRNSSEILRKSYNILSQHSTLSVNFNVNPETPKLCTIEPKVTKKETIPGQYQTNKIEDKKEIPKREIIQNQYKLNATKLKNSPAVSKNISNSDLQVIKKELYPEDDKNHYTFSEGPIYLPKYVDIGDNLMCSLIDKESVSEKELKSHLKVHGPFYLKRNTFKR